MRRQTAHVSHGRHTLIKYIIILLLSSVKCPELSIENGKVTVTDATAMYECDAEYELTGADTRQCQDNGDWSAVAPTCTPTGKYCMHHVCWRNATL